MTKQKSRPQHKAKVRLADYEPWSHYLVNGSYEQGAEPAASADTQALQGKGKTRFDKAPLPLFVPQDQFSASFGTKAGSS